MADCGARERRLGALRQRLPCLLLGDRRTDARPTAASCARHGRGQRPDQSPSRARSLRRARARDRSPRRRVPPGAVRPAASRAAGLPRAYRRRGGRRRPGMSALRIAWLGHSTVLARAGRRAAADDPAPARPSRARAPRRRTGDGGAARHRRGADLAPPLRPPRRVVAPPSRAPSACPPAEARAGSCAAAVSTSPRSRSETRFRSARSPSASRPQRTRDNGALGA